MLPELNRIRRASTNISVFRGLNRTVNTGFSRIHNNSSVHFTEFADMKNLCGDEYPRLSTRKKRSRVGDFEVKSNLLAANGNLIYVIESQSAGKLCIGTTEYTITDYQTGAHYLTQYGNNVLIQPEKLYFNLSTYEFSNIEFSVESSSTSTTALNCAEFNTGTRRKDEGRHINFRDFSIEKVALDDNGKPRTVNYIYEKASGLDNYSRQTNPSGTIDSDDDTEVWQAEYYVYWGTIRPGETVEAQGESPSGVYRCADVMLKEETIDGKTYQTLRGLLKLIKVETNYVKISRIKDGNNGTVIGELDGIKKGDFVKISGMESSVATVQTDETDNTTVWDTSAGWGNYIDVLNNNIFKVYYADENSIVIYAPIEKSVPYNGPMTIERVMPAIDDGKLLEVSNRLWACSSQNNEIYSSKQGDCTNWQAYGDGIATDSYAMTVGNEGEFTGIARQNDSVIFFKENWILKIYGTKPSNFALASYNVPGVEKGSEKSIVWVNGVLFYLSHIGVCQYSPGGQPVVISKQAFGSGEYKNGVAGRHRNKYYISAQNENGVYELFVFDTDTGLWHREDETQMLSTVTYNNVMYYVDAKTGALMCCDSENNLLSGATEGDVEREGEFDWSFETGNMYEDTFGKKYISKLQLGIEADGELKARVFAKYENGGAWFMLREVYNLRRNHCIIPVAVRRADYLKLRVEGTGACRVSGIEIEYTGGSSKVWQY